MPQENSGNRAAQPSLPGLAHNPIADMQKLLLMTPHFQAALLKAVLAQQSATLSFLGRRCQEDMKLAERIGAANSLSDMISVCFGFCKDAAQDYAEHAGKATDIGSDIALVTVANLQQEVESAMETMRAEAA